jgi:hypothetical protein
MVRAIAYFLLAASCSILTSCSDRGDPAQAPRPFDPAGISFANDIQPIFSARCAISGCHVLPTPTGGLVLSAGSSYANLVNVPTQVFTPGVRVTPNDVAASVLYLLVSSGTMPATGSPLTTAQINAIREWIESGAPNN